MPFSPSVQHCRNTDTMVQCAQCDKWRLVFSKKKLNNHQRNQLAELLADVEYTCGFVFGEYGVYKRAMLPFCIIAFTKFHVIVVNLYSFNINILPDDLNLPHGLQVFVKDHDCLDHIEKLYYACGYKPCCIQCGEYLCDIEEVMDTYPQCEDCHEPLVQKRA